MIVLATSKHQSGCCTMLLCSGVLMLRAVHRVQAAAARERKELEKLARKREKEMEKRERELAKQREKAEKAAKTKRDQQVKRLFCPHRHVPKDIPPGRFSGGSCSNMAAFRFANEQWCAAGYAHGISILGQKIGAGNGVLVFSSAVSVVPHPTLLQACHTTHRKLPLTAFRNHPRAVSWK